MSETLEQRVNRIDQFQDKIFAELSRLESKDKELAESGEKISKALIDTLALLTRARHLLHANNLAVGALAATHQNREEALKLFQKAWQSGRGQLGAEDITEEIRADVEREVANIAKALGGKVM